MPHHEGPKRRRDRRCEPCIASLDHGDRDESVRSKVASAALREIIARIEARTGFDVGRVGARGAGFMEVPEAEAERQGLIRLGNGSLPLDRYLGGGLRRGALHEIVAAHKQDDGAAAGFATALAVLCAGTGPLVWIVEDYAARETGSPYRPGLVGHGLDTSRLILVRTNDAQTTLWAVEETLRLQSPVVLAELWGARHYGLVPSRRLLLAAQAGRGTALLLHAGLAGKAETLSSAAETRFAVASHPSSRIASAGNRMPIPGTAAFAVRILKLRLGSHIDFDRDRSHPLVWDSAQRCFDDHPVSVGVPSPSADRPAQAAKPAAHVQGPVGTQFRASVG